MLIALAYNRNFYRFLCRFFSSKWMCKSLTMPSNSWWGSASWLSWPSCWHGARKRQERFLKCTRLAKLNSFRSYFHLQIWLPKVVKGQKCMLTRIFLLKLFNAPQIVLLKFCHKFFWLGWNICFVVKLSKFKSRQERQKYEVRQAHAIDSSILTAPRI